VELPEASAFAASPQAAMVHQSASRVVAQLSPQLLQSDEA